MAKTVTKRKNDFLAVPLYATLVVFLITEIFIFTFVFRAGDLGKAALFAFTVPFVYLFSIFAFRKKEVFNKLKNPLSIAILTYVACLIFSTIFSINRTTSFYGVYERHIGLVIQLPAYLLSFVILLSAQKKEHIALAKHTLIFIGFLNAIVGISQFLGYEPITGTVGRSSAMGLTGNADFFGPVVVPAVLLSLSEALLDVSSVFYFVFLIAYSLMIISIMLSAQGAVVGLIAGIVFYFILRITNKNIIKDAQILKKEKIIIVITTASVLIGMLMNISDLRGNIIAILLGLLISLFLYIFMNSFAIGKNTGNTFNKLIKVSRIALVITLIFVLVGTYFWFTLSSIEFAKHVPFTFATRFELWRTTIKLAIAETFKHGRIFGIGLENYRRYFMIHKPIELAQIEPEVNYDDPHNNYFGILAKAGIPGFISYIAMFIVALLMMYKIIFKDDEKDIKNKLTAMALAAAIAGYMANMFTIFDMITNILSISILLGIIMAFYVRVTSLKNNNEAQKDINEHNKDAWIAPVSKFVIILMLFFTIYGSYYYLQVSMADHYLRQSFINTYIADYYIDYVQKTATLNEDVKEKILSEAASKVFESFDLLNDAMRVNPRESNYGLEYMKTMQKFLPLIYMSNSTKTMDYVSNIDKIYSKYIETTWMPENYNIIMAGLMTSIGNTDGAIHYLYESFKYDKYFFGSRLTAMKLCYQKAQEEEEKKNSAAALQYYIAALENAKMVKDVLQYAPIIYRNTPDAFRFKNIYNEADNLEKEILKKVNM